MSSKPNWLNLPSDVTANILCRLDGNFILQKAQIVCTTWYNICKDPAMWRVIDMHNSIDLYDKPYYITDMCKHAVDRSQGQLLEINIERFGYHAFELLHYIADRSSKLRCLQILYPFNTFREDFGEVLQKLPLLEELNLTLTNISIEDIEPVGRWCPLLKTLNINRYWLDFQDDEEAIAISKSLPNVRHLQLIGNMMSNIGLQAILDACHHLESLDLRLCHNIKLDEGDLGLRCHEQIKCLRLPSDSVEDHKHSDELSYEPEPYVRSGPSAWSYPSSNSDSDEEDFTSFDNINDWEKDFIEPEDFKDAFEMSYEINMKERKKRHVQKVLSKRKKKSIRNIQSKWKQKAIFKNSYKKERKRRSCSNVFDLES